MVFRHSMTSGHVCVRTEMAGGFSGADLLEEINKPAGFRATQGLNGFTEDILSETSQPGGTHIRNLIRQLVGVLDLPRCRRLPQQCTVSLRTSNDIGAC